MTLTKMTLQAYKDGTFATTVGSPYTVFLNPESISRNSINNYDSTRPAGTAAEAPRFLNSENGTLSFSLLLDGTRTIGGNTVEVRTEIQTLRTLAFTYEGDSHSPNYTQVSWGSMLFKGRLTNFNINYTLFRPDGTPVRAKVDLSFISYTSPKDAVLLANNLSADLSHHHVVRAGDTLPLLCHRIYGDSRYYLQVAHRNRLVHFSRLVPGTVLLFPPLRP